MSLLTSLAEISYLLGFQETTSFYRAFAAWTGQTPEVYRESRREQQSRSLH